MALLSLRGGPAMVCSRGDTGHSSADRPGPSPTRSRHRPNRDPAAQQSPALQRCAIRFDRRRPPHPPRLRASWPARGDPMKRREFIRPVGGAARAAWRHTGRLPPGVSADALFSGQMRRETNSSMERPPIIPAKRSIPGQILSGGPQLWTKVMIRTSPAWVPI